MESLSKQTLDRDKFEVILIKDFSDQSISNLAKELGFVQVQCSHGSLAQKVLAGFRVSRGNVLTLLDYDDRYVHSRLKKLYEIFLENTKLGYLHDGIECIDSTGRRSTSGLPLVYWMMMLTVKRAVVSDAQKVRTCPRLGFSRPDFHGMTLRRPVFASVLPYLSRIQGTVDTLLFNGAWIFPLDVGVEPRALYQYRIHSGGTSFTKTSSMEDPNRGSQDWRARRRADYGVIREMIRAGERVELLRDFEFRNYSDDLLELIASPATRRRDIRKMASALFNHFFRTNVSPLLIYTLAVLVIFIVSPYISRLLIGSVFRTG